MSSEVGAIDDGYDRLCLDYSSKLAGPLWWGYNIVAHRLFGPLGSNKFDNVASKVKEFAIRAFILASGIAVFSAATLHTLIVTVVLVTASLLLRVIGFSLQKNRFTHVAGKISEQPLKKGQTSVMTWPICGEYGGLQYKKDGVIQWRSRIDRIVDQIQAKDPDILVLQQVNDTALAETLIQRLSDQYAHFYMHMGGGALRSTNGCMVIAKCAIENFTHHELADRTSFESFEIKAHPDDTTPCALITTTALPSGKENQEKRMRHVAKIVDFVAERTVALPSFLVGNNAYEGDLDPLSLWLHPSYRLNEPTSTDQLALQWDPKLKPEGETYGFISLFKRTLPDGRTLPVIEKGIRLLDCDLVPGFTEEFNTKEALSKYHGILTTFSLGTTNRR
jgi:hypothetical protein